MRTILFVLLVAAFVSTPTAQEVAFEVASVRRSENLRGPISYVTPPDAVTATNYPLKWFIAHAYSISIPDIPYRLIGGSDRILDAQFSINAKAPQGTSPDRIRLMMQSLLAARFNFRFHREARQRPVYALVVARQGRFGEEFRPSQYDCEALMDARGRAARAGDQSGAVASAPLDAKKRPICVDDPSDVPVPRGAHRVRSAGPLAELIASIQSVADRPIIDSTQLTGNFEWQLVFSRARIPDVNDEYPSLGVALEEQLGLKLQPQTMPFDALVIDSLDLPTAD